MNSLGFESQQPDDYDAQMQALLNAWEAGGCVGPLPPPGPRPWKYTEEDWLGIHRLVVGAILRENGKELPADYTQDERREVEELAHYGRTVGAELQLSRMQQARLFPYEGAIRTFERAATDKPPSVQPGGTSRPDTFMHEGI